MEKSIEIFLSPPLLTPPSTIQQVPFSIREIDILACLLGRRSTKKVASLLDISPRTVENYIRNLTIKIGCNSREGIIDFIERSHEIDIIQQHYKQLQIQVEFENALKSIAKLNIFNSLQCALAFEDGHVASSLSFFKPYLKIVGLNIEEGKDSKVSCLIYIVSNATIKKLQGGQPIKSLIPSSSRVSGTILYICFDNQSLTLSNNFKTSKSIKYIKEDNRYFLIFDILTKLVPSSQVDALLLDFKNKYDHIMRNSRDFYSCEKENTISEEGVPTICKAVPLHQTFFDFLKIRKKLVSVSLLAVVFLLQEPLL